MAKQQDGLKALRGSINEASSLFTELSNEIIKLQKNGKTAAEITKQLGDQMDIASKKFKSVSGAVRAQQKEFKKSSQDYKNATSAIKGLNTGISSLDSLYKRATKTQATFGSEFRKQFSSASLGKAAGNLVKYVGSFKLFNLALSAVKNITVGAAKAAIEYQAELAKLSAVTGASSNEMEELSDNILDVAGSTKFTSSEIVKLQTSLGKLGFSTQEIIASTQAIANVAQALGEDAAPVAEKVGQILNQFNLQAAESVMVGDVLVSTINNSALSFESFGTAIQYVGPLAAELGTSFVELSGAMAILADNGFTASRIGTGLRGILTELGKTGQDLESIIRDLADEEISFAEAIELVGKRSAAQLLTLVENIEALEDAESAYHDAGAAILASSKQISTFAGNTELLNSAWNAFLINIGEFISKSNFVRGALRILDSEAANTAEGLERISVGVSAETLGKGIGAAVTEFEKLNKESSDFDANLTSAKTVAVNQIAGEILKTDEKMLELLADQIRYENQSINTVGRANKLQGTKNKIIELEFETRQQVSDALDKELDQQILISAAQIERNRITEEYKDTFEELSEISNEEKISAAAAAKQNEEVEKVLSDLASKRKKILDGEIKSLRRKRDFGLELSTDESRRLLTLEAQVNAYDTQISKFRNLLVLADQIAKVDKGKAKTFNEEIDNLETLIDRQKNVLENKLLENKLAREAILGQLENTENDKEKEALRSRLLALESDNLLIQQSSFLIITNLIEEFRQKLEKAGLSAEETEKALQKMAEIEFKVSGLSVDIKEFGKAAKQISDDFKERFGKELTKGEELSAEQKLFVNNYLDNLFNSFGENLTDKQKNILRELVFSRIFGDKEDLDKETEKTKRQIKGSIQDILDELGDVFDEYNDTYLQKKKSRLEAELDSVRRASEIEQEILSSQLNNQLITEGQFRAKSIELQKVQLAKENSIKKQIFESEKKADLRNVRAETLEALASNILNNFEKYDFTTAGILAILATASVGAAGLFKANAINQRQFTPVKFEDGGMVNGPSHSEGGVPFSVRGQSGYEMEGGEFIVNKKAASLHRDILERINNSAKVSGSSGRYQFANGGIVSPNANESVDYLKAIAEATTSTAIQSSKPVRAFVSSKDLRSDANERRIRDRNDRI